MSATTFTVMKQGDTFDIYYLAKNLTTGLTDVTAIPYNPAGIAQTAIALVEMGNTGRYRAIWDSTGKDLGVWTFTVDSVAKAAPADTKVQVVNNQTLADSVFSRIVDLAGAIGADITGVASDVTSIKGTVDSTTFGLGALKSLIDTLQGSVSNIQNVTRVSVAMPEALLIPGTGSLSYKVFVNIYDTDGNMEDPDNQDLTDGAWLFVSVATSLGVSRNSNLGSLTPSVFDGKNWLTRDSLGRFYFTYSVPDSHAIEDLIFTFGYKENAIDLRADRTVRTIADASDLNAALGTIDANVDSIKSIVESATYGNSALKLLLDTANAALVDGATGLAAIKTAVVANGSVLTDGSYGLSALKTLVDSIVTATGNTNLDLTAIKGTGWVADANLQTIYTNTLPGGLCV